MTEKPNLHILFNKSARCLIEYGREWKANLFGFLDRCGFELLIDVEINSRGYAYIILTREFLANVANVGRTLDTSEINGAVRPPP